MGKVLYMILINAYPDLVTCLVQIDMSRLFKVASYCLLLAAIIHSWASCQIRKIAGAHAPGMLGTFSPSPQVSDPDMRHARAVVHAGIANYM